MVAIVPVNLMRPQRFERLERPERFERDERSEEVGC